MLNVIINEHLYDEDFASKWCYGFEKLVTHMQKYTPEWAEPITGLPTSQIREVARLYGVAKSACINAGNAFDQTVDSNNAVRAVAILIAISGNLDRPGSGIFNLLVVILIIDYDNLMLSSPCERKTTSQSHLR